MYFCSFWGKKIIQIGDFSEVQIMHQSTITMAMKGPKESVNTETTTTPRLKKRTGENERHAKPPPGDKIKHFRCIIMYNTYTI